ncbi:NlpC/P60 family protein [Streptomyces sp. CRN 30]|uniref:C40 family peptidase n=1 Tax=Streptomyces sp. CRN 30 TaxID=3075613 RepID=UPI002A7EE4B1|nr:NlpC/P60 family protein [Streptomyces sp. CRN 30]
MAPHRKPRPARTRAGIRTPALATAALTSVALLSQTADAAPATDDRPNLEDVEKKVDALYRQAESATETYNAAKEKTTKQKKRADTLLDDMARRTEQLNEARERLGSFAAAQYRTGSAVSGTAALLLADDPQDYLHRNQLTDRLTARQQDVVDDFIDQRAETANKREEAAESLATLTESQNTLQSAKAEVQAKLAEARGLLSRLTAEEKARLASIEQEEQEQAERRAAELARQEAAAAEAEAEARAEREAAQEQAAPQETAPAAGAGSGATADDSGYASKAAKVLALARAQIGKPYVWGATGPDSYDCSGLTQAAWKAAGVDLPRTTYDQVEAGTTVSLSDIRPGDLVFFYDDITHVGLYVGNGMMIHAPKPGTYVREESIFYDGESSIHGVVRPA